MKLESLKLEKFRANEISSKQLKHVRGGDECTGGGVTNIWGQDSNGNYYLVKSYSWDSDSRAGSGLTTYDNYLVTYPDGSTYAPTHPQIRR